MIDLLEPRVLFSTIDLAPLRITAPHAIALGKKQTVHVTIINNGDTAAVGNLAVDLKASVSGTIDADSLDLGTTTKRVNIRAGKTISLALTETLPTTGGPYFIVANVDPANTFSETTFANNQLATTTAPTGQAGQAVNATNTATVKLTRLATVPAEDGTPQDIVTAQGVSNRQYVATRNGDILTLTGGTLSPTPFLDMSAAGVTLYTDGEGGFLGLAFSTTFSKPKTFGFGKFYTFDTEPFSTDGPAADFSSPELFPTTGILPNNQIVIREWSVLSPKSATANLTSRVLMRIDHPQSNHQGGSLRIGPDGDLYIGLGDGGAAADEVTASDPTDGHTNATGNGEDPNVVFGKILRINPNPAGNTKFTVSANGQYSIPKTNPFVNGGGLGEIYAIGLRNPFRMSFDTNGQLYVGNVGQNVIESFDRVTLGGNYGWPFYEGTRNDQTDTSRTAPAGFTFNTPLAEYTHADGIAIIGGVAVHAIPKLKNQYLFADLGGPTGAVGRLLYAPTTGGPISAANIDPNGVVPTSNIYGFGVDQHGMPEAFFANGDILTVS